MTPPKVTGGPSPLTPDQQDMLRLIQQNPDSTKSNITMLFSLDHAGLTRTMTTDARLQYIDNLYDSMRTHYQAMQASGQVATSGQPPHGSGLVGPRRHSPQSGEAARVSGRSAHAGRSDTQIFESRLRGTVQSAVEGVLKGTGTLMNGKIDVQYTVGADGRISNVRVTGNGIQGLAQFQRDAINEAISSSVRLLTLPPSMRPDPDTGPQTRAQSFILSQDQQTIIMERPFSF